MLEAVLVCHTILGNWHGVLFPVQFRSGTLQLLCAIPQTQLAQGCSELWKGSISARNVVGLFLTSVDYPGPIYLKCGLLKKFLSLQQCVH